MDSQLKPASQSERYPADLYVALHQGTTGDVDVYANRCKGAERILELGCGDGRLLAGLLGTGAEVTGVDVDPQMLAFARQRLESHSEVARLSLLEADMCSLPELGLYDRVVLGFNGLFCLRGDERKLQCFRQIRLLLKDTGLFFLDVYASDALDEDADGVELEPDEDEPELLREVEAAGRMYAVFERNRWWPSRGELEAEYEYRPIDAEGESAYGRILHSYCGIGHVVDLLAASGFRAGVDAIVELPELPAPQVLIAARPI